MNPAYIVLAAFAALQVDPRTIAKIEPAHQLVEGVAADTKTFWVSSVIDGVILACRKSCSRMAIVEKGLHPLGIAWDERRRWLWVAADCPNLPGLKTCSRGALIALDGRGRPRARLQPDGGAFHPGDVSSSAGQVFVSDSANGAVYRTDARAEGLITIVAAGAGGSAQGTALEDDGRTLLVSDYSRGLAEVALDTGERRPLRRENGEPLRGIDGVARCGATFLGIYNATLPARLISFQIDKGVVRISELLKGPPLFDPTQLAVQGNHLLVISNAGWEAAGKGTKGRPAAAPVLAMQIPSECSSGK